MKADGMAARHDSADGNYSASGPPSPRCSTDTGADTSNNTDKKVTRPDLSGKWHIYESHNFEEFLRVNGANWMIRKIVKNLSTPSEIHQDGDEFFLRVFFLVFSRDEKFRIGKEYEQKQPDGSVSRGLAHWEGDTLVVTYTSTDGSNPGQKIERRIIAPDTMETVMTCGDVSCRRLAKRVP